MTAAIQIEVLRVLAYLLLGSLIGELVDAPVWGALIGLLAISAYHFRYALALLKWLDKPKKNELPDGYGIWRLINQASYESWKRSRKRKRQLTAIVQEFRASTAALPDAVIVLDRSLSIAWFNQAARDLLRLSKSRDKGIRINNLLRHPSFTNYLNNRDELAAGVEMPGLHDTNQTLWVRLVDYGQGQKLLLARDISKLKHIEQSRRDFVANASHELRTPLTVVRGYLDMMQVDAEQGGSSPLMPWREPLGEMSRQANRMQKIIEDLLKLANLERRGRSDVKAVIDMPALIAGSLEEAEILSDGKHKISTAIDADLTLRGEQTQIHSIISNLLSNALRYTPEGGQVRLEWARLATGGARLSVKDSGIGIAENDIPRLTERFYRADAARSRATGGTGLGLAIVKHALEQHDASLRIESQVGRGSEFICLFPATRVDTLSSRNPLS